MTNQENKKKIVISLLIFLSVIIITVLFCVREIYEYELPNEENTSLEKGRVVDIYRGSKSSFETILFENGEKLYLVSPDYNIKLFASLGITEQDFQSLVIGQEIEYRRMQRQPYIVELKTSDRNFNNEEMTVRYIKSVYIGLALIGIFIIIIAFAAEIEYLKGIRKKWK